MSSDQSIEDLINASVGDDLTDDSTTAKFASKQKQLKRKELERIIKAKAALLGLPYINLAGFPISPEALSLIREDVARDLGAVCFYYDGKKVELAAVNPQNQKIAQLMEELKEKYFVSGEVYLMSSNSLTQAMMIYKSIPIPREVIKGVKISEDDLSKYSEKFNSFNDLQAEINQAKITDIVTMIMAASIKSNASDIHIEAEEKGIKIRFRIDGVLHDTAIVDKEEWEKIISRLKLLAGVKINVNDKPQDGRFSIFMTNDRVDIRASFLPTVYGESVVIRLLRSSSVGLEFEDLGILGRAHDQLKKEVERPNGLIITTGPTGSGKTTTLYAMLKKLNNPETKIITIEDPIEYQLSGVNQSQTGKNYTFAQGLRSIVRQDPDIIMVGEIRDLETAEIAIQAALTGHLVLSTIHTNDAAGTVPRFLSMGAKPFLLAPALNAMIGQRLVRKICDHCKREVELDKETGEKVKAVLDKLSAEEKEKIKYNQELTGLKFYQGQGCEYCQGIGYKGRIGIYEVMVMNPEIEKLILSGQSSEYDMRENAVKNGMITMVQDGLIKALLGITSIEEVFRVAE